MNKGVRILNVLIALVILISLLHSSIHITLFKTNYSLVELSGLSGLVVGENTIDNLESYAKKNERIPFPSMIIIIFEWVLVFSLMTLSIVKRKLTRTMEKATHIELIKKKSKLDTDIDILYEIIKKNKKVPLSRLAQLFKVDKKVVEEWGKILEESGYVIVDYPRFGDIEIILKDEEASKA